MEIRNILENYDYPVIFTPKTLISNVNLIRDNINKFFGKEKKVWLIGTGTSGAMIITMILSEPQENFFPFLIMKKNENTHRNTYSIQGPPFDFENDIFVVIDDCTVSGSTFSYIKNSLNNYPQYPEILSEKVSCVSANTNQTTVKNYFPNTKLLIC